MKNLIKVTKKKKTFGIIGQKDPRGIDNKISVYINDKEQLIIEVDTPKLRCYVTKDIQILPSMVRIIQE